MADEGSTALRYQALTQAEKLHTYFILWIFTEYPQYLAAQFSFDLDFLPDPAIIEPELAVTER